LVSLYLVLAFFFIYFFILIRPSNYRDWEFGQENPPRFEVNNNLISVKGVRDFHFEPQKITAINYIDRQVDINNLERVWFLIEPFGGNEAVAHTYFVFDFKDSPPLAVSVEARREKGEKYDAFIGVFNKYELIYIWGTESDETIRRVIFENNKLYMYPLKISEKGAKKLFLQLAETSHNLETTPRFYNTLSSNCTNELAKAANAVKPGAVPLNIALFLPGYSVKELYKLGYLPTDTAVEKLPERFYISDFVRENYNKEDFSKLLRDYLRGV